MLKKFYVDTLTGNKADSEESLIQLSSKSGAIQGFINCIVDDDDRGILIECSKDDVINKLFVNVFTDKKISADLDTLKASFPTSMGISKNIDTFIENAYNSDGEKPVNKYLTSFILSPRNSVSMLNMEDVIDRTYAALVPSLN